MAFVKNSYSEANYYYQMALDSGYDVNIAATDYAIFLTEKMNHLNKVEVIFGRMDKNTRGYARGCAVYAKYLIKIGGHDDRADNLFRIAIEVEPENLDVLSRYAIFLQTTGRDLVKARSLHETVLAKNEKNANTLGNLAQIVLSFGEIERGRLLINNSFENAKIPEERDLILELWFYRFAHFFKEYPDAREKIITLLKDGVRDEGWDFSRTIARAEADGHPDVPMLKKLADVILKKQPLESL